MSKEMCIDKPFFFLKKKKKKKKDGRKGSSIEGDKGRKEMVGKNGPGGLVGK